MIIVSIIAVPLILAVGSIAIAWRGVRIDDHPLCRRCGFDLFGKPADATRCSECGSALNSPGAVMIGRRKWRRTPLAFGILLLLVLPMIASINLDDIRSFRWQDHLPVTYLVSRAFSANGSTRSWAIGTLLERCRSGHLDREQWDEIVSSVFRYERDEQVPVDNGWAMLMQWRRARGNLSDELWSKYIDLLVQETRLRDSERSRSTVRELADAADIHFNDATKTPYIWDHAIESALTYQGDSTRKWESAWGEMIEKLRDGGFVSDRDWTRYASQAFVGQCTLRLRPRVRLGDPIPFLIGTDLPRLARASAVETSIAGWSIRWVEVPKWSWDGGSNRFVDSDGKTVLSLVEPDWQPPARFLNPGTQHMQFAATAHAQTRAIGGAIAPIAEFPIVLSGTFELLPSYQPSVKMVKNPELTETIRKSIVISMDWIPGEVNPDGSPKLNLAWTSYQVDVHSPPANLAFNVDLVGGGKYPTAISFACRASPSDLQFNGGSSGNPIPGKTVDFVLHSDPLVAASTLDMFEAWDGELSFGHVPSKRTNPARQR